MLGEIFFRRKHCEERELLFISIVAVEEDAGSREENDAAEEIANHLKKMESARKIKNEKEGAAKDITEYLRSQKIDIEMSIGEPPEVLSREEVLEACNYNIESLKSFTIPKGKERIGKRAFAGATSLEEVVFNEKVIFIHAGAFFGCSALEKINFPKDLIFIDDDAFGSCTKIRALDFPESLIGIGKQAFMGCCSLRTVRFPKKLKEIENAAFQGCYELVKIDFPEDGELMRLGYKAFGDNPKLKSSASGRLPTYYMNNHPDGQIVRAFTDDCTVSIL